MIKIKNKENEKGITLVALVVTIIILLILAGVGLNALIGENGIIKRSRDSAQKYKNAEQNEQDLLKQTENWIDDNYSGGSGNKEYTDSNGDKALIPDGFEVSKEPGEDKIEDGLVIKDVDGNEFVWIPVQDTSSMFIENGVSLDNHAGRLYSTGNLGDTFDIGLIGQTWSSGEYREPAVITNGSDEDNNNVRLLEAGFNGDINGFRIQLQNEFNEMKKSVEKYKGFYCGRYETGDLSKSKVVVQKGNSDINNQNWYTSYKKAKEMYQGNTSVQSSMIWGCQWDQIMLDMKDIPNTLDNSQKYIKNSKGMGNYDDSTFSYTNESGIQTIKPENSAEKIPTGSTEISRVKNIYDMAGNVSEWTQSAHYTNVRRTQRGGEYTIPGTWYPASSIDNRTPSMPFYYCGFRTQIYLSI